MQATSMIGFIAVLLVGSHLTVRSRGAVEFEDEYDEYDEGSLNPPAKAKAAATPRSSTALKPQAGSAAGPDEAPFQVTVPLQHSLASGEFTDCGEFTALVTQQPANNAVRLSQLKVKRLPVSEPDKKVLVQMLLEEQSYRVRVPANVLGASEGRWVMSSLPMRCLVNADLRENFVLHVDDQGNLLAMDYTSPSGECALEETAPPARWDFTATAYVRLPKDAPRLNPDFYMSYSAGAQRSSQAQGDPAAGAVNTYMEDGPRGNKKKDQHWFSKYWMYIVPVGLIMLNGALAPPEQQQARAAARKNQ